ncbi:M1 family aminopeptidase [Spirosoma utsteinense]|uniref:Aminopeptidase N n=1 Tax=Spirosoma utsteinense TaxID=2585773 RepID=A0ABR6W015_9BACT|nr:M1 family aminopeptidase [Spirosoma utsteinense]MBC3786566.1 aminopeptidase N [Spirosoma utsteinense]MBC3789944.1 aminopeptidase N [Spirosoma utsteinense]
MKLHYLLFLLPLFVNAQSDRDGGAVCRTGKLRSQERLATNPKARLAYPGDASIDVTYYGLAIHLTHSPNYLRASATITLKSTVANLTSFFLDLNSTSAITGEGLRVDSVKAGTQHLVYQFAQNKLVVTPAQPLANGQAVTLTVFYQGIPNSRDLGSFRFSTHERTSEPAIWSLSEPYGAPDWFPCRDSPADKADSSSVRITAPARFVSVSNGTLVSTTDNPDGTRTYHWRNSYPIAQYLISVALSNYERYDTPVTQAGQLLPVTHYIYPEVLPLVRANLDLTPAMLRLFTERFGPYPFLREKYGHAQIGQGNGGMEHQTISSMEERALTPTVIAHELAHQWFGDKITCRDWQNIWLNEGFASYAEAVYAESVSGRAGYLATMNAFAARARNASGSIYVQDISNFANIFNSNRSYAKGATVLHMLRGIVGDSTFFRILRTYTAAPAVAYGTAVTEDFQAIAQQVSGQDLAYFFRQWIYGEGYPTYRVTVSDGTSANTTTVRLEQRNGVASAPLSFTMPIQVRIQSAAGDTTVSVVNNRTDQTFLLPSRGKVTGVVIDPDNWILKTVESTTLVITAASEPSLNSFRVYPNPTADALTVDFATSTVGPTTLLLTNMLGQRVHTRIEQKLLPGNHTRTFDLTGLSAGQYTVLLQTPDGSQSRVVLVR